MDGWPFVTGIHRWFPSQKISNGRLFIFNLLGALTSYWGNATSTRKLGRLMPYRSPLQWRHNGRGGVSNHRRLDCLLNRLFRRRSKKPSKLRVTRLYERNSPVTGEFPTQRASNAEVSIWFTLELPVWVTMTFLWCDTSLLVHWDHFILTIIYLKVVTNCPIYNIPGSVW